LRAAYKKIAESTDLLSLVDDIALMQLRCNQLTARVGTGESNAKWKELKEVYSRFKTASSTGDKEELSAALRDFDRLIRGGDDDTTAWVELQNAIDRKSILQGREWKRLADMQALATAEQVRVLVRSIAESVMRNVPDENARRAIVNDIVRLRVFDYDVASPLPAGVGPIPADDDDAGGIRGGDSPALPAGTVGNRPVGREPGSDPQGTVADH